MTALAGIGFLLMLAAIGVMLVVIRQHRVSHLGLLFLAAAFLYHFVGEVVVTTFPGRDIYREFINQSAVDTWLVVAGGAMVSFAAAYALTVGKGGGRLIQPIGKAGAWPRWTTLLAVTLPMWLIASGVQSVTGQDAKYWAGGLISDFLLLLVPLTLFLYLDQASHPRAGLAILIQSVALIFLGQRSFVIAPIVVVAWAASLAGKPLGKGVAILVVGTLAVFVVVLSTTRVTLGRDVFSSGSGADRAKALLQGASSVGSADLSHGRVEDDFVYRLDGNAWPAYVLSSQAESGTAPLSGLKYDATVSVPSFIFVSKLSQHVLLRDEEGRIDFHYRIPSAAVPPGPDWLPTILGTLMAYLGRWWVVVATGVVGWGLAVWDKRAHALPLRFSRVVLGMGIAECILRYEGDLQDVIVTLRGAVLIWLFWEASVRLMRGRRPVQEPIGSAPASVDSLVCPENR